MKKQIVTKDFNLAYSLLEQLGDEAVLLIIRDGVYLILFGVDDAAKDFIKDKTEELKNFPTNEELQGAVTVATEAKDLSVDIVKVDIRGIMTRVGNTFGEHSGKYRMFGTVGMDEMDDNDLVRCGRRVGRMASKFSGLLLAKGVTAPMIATLMTDVKTLDDNIDLKGDAVKERDNATEDRAILGNLLYNAIVEVYKSGKNYWVDKSEAKYNDYVIYDTPTGSPQPAPGTTDIRCHVTRQDTGKAVAGVSLGIMPGNLTLVANNSGLTPVQNIPGSSLMISANVAGFNPYYAPHTLEGGNVVFEVVLVPMVAPPIPK